MPLKLVSIMFACASLGRFSNFPKKTLKKLRTLKIICLKYGVNLEREDTVVHQPYELSLTTEREAPLKRERTAATPSAPFLRTAFAA